MRYQLSILIILGTLLLIAASCDDDPHTEPVPCEFYCAPSAGYPCPCTAASGCNDGSVCSGILQSDVIGFCARPCESAVDCEIAIECEGQPQCVLTTPQGKACAYVCEGDWDCPKNMACTEAGNGKLCYPMDQPDAG